MRTQAALYEEIDLELSWSEAELPERERTKHVHRLQTKRTASANALGPSLTPGTADMAASMLGIS